MNKIKCRIGIDKMNYLKPLPEGITLEVFNGEELIFSSRKKWLNPLFELENFLNTYQGARTNLCSHDSAIGKAAAVLTVRLGIKKINADLISENAKTYIEKLNLQIENPLDKIQLEYSNIVPKLLCATEAELENLFDSEQMYFLLRQRAKLVQGVEVKACSLCSEYGTIRNLSFDLKSGGHLMILGENGAGKTTLLKIIAGIKKPLSGYILIDGKPVSELEKFSVGYIPQFTENTNFSLSVEEVVSLGIPPAKKNKAELIENALVRTSSLHLLKRSFSSLSGGEKQKVNLSRCLAQNAKLLLLDEPTASLDFENRKMVIDILRSLTVSEIPTIIVVTHDEELAKMKNWEIMKLQKE
ncbi:MAG: DUF1893 domain-containing protein [Treponema sp.]